MNSLALKPTGINTDIPASELPLNLVSDAQNFNFKAEGALRARGYNPFAVTLSENPNYLLGFLADDDIFRYIYPGVSDIFLTDQNNEIDITPTVAPNNSVPGVWSGDTLNSVPVLTNGIDNPWYYPGNSNPMLPLPGWPANTTCGWIRSFEYFLIAGDIEENSNEYRNKILWSNSAEPGAVPTTWAASASNDAGDNILAQTYGRIIDGAKLRDFFILAKPHSLYIMQYIGGNDVFAFKKLSSTSGVMTSNCMQEYRGLLYVFGDGDIYRTDGTTIESIAEDRIKNTIFNDINYEYYDRCFIQIHQALSQIWFCYPSGASTIADKAWIYDVLHDAWGCRAIPDCAYIEAGITNNDDLSLTWSDTDTWDSDATLWNQSGQSEIADGLALASHDQEIYGLSFAEDFAGVAPTAYIERQSMDFGDLGNMKFVSSVFINAAGTNGDTLTVEVGYQMQENEAVTYGESQTFTIGTSGRLSFSVTGRLISIRITSTASNYWRVHEINFEYRTAGRY